MGHSDAINTLRKASAAYGMWSGIADDGILGTRTADVEHSAAVALRNAVKGAYQSGATVDEIAREALIPYATAFLLTR